MTTQENNDLIIQTTVRMTDELHCQAKIAAAMQRVTLNELFVAAIEKAIKYEQPVR